MLTWLHFGDLHASDEDGWESLARLEEMIVDVNRHLVGAIDFAFLPGDNANHGTAVQYRRIRHLMQTLRCPWHAIPGDHDFEPGHLANFHRGLGVPRLPYRIDIDGRQCLFLDIVSHGRGGPDFRLGPDQARWLRDRLAASRHDARRPVIFMHAFPGDLAEDAVAVALLFAEHGVACVDTGHTHYNEVLNDGSVIYTATRSTGQIEEGPPGYSLHAVDGGVVAWRFKEAARPWPFVLITAPADRRLVSDPTSPEQRPSSDFTVRAKVFGPNIVRVTASVDGQVVAALHPVPDTAGAWFADLRGLAMGDHVVRVDALDADGSGDADSIGIEVAGVLRDPRSPVKAGPGQDRHSIGAWPQRGLLGTQLGPNKHGRKW